MKKHKKKKHHKKRVKRLPAHPRDLCWPITPYGFLGARLNEIRKWSLKRLARVARKLYRFRVRKVLPTELRKKVLFALIVYCLQERLRYKYGNPMPEEIYERIRNIARRGVDKRDRWVFGLPKRRAAR